MLLPIPDLLTPDQLQRARALLAAADWADGNLTAGRQSAQVKRNLQLPETAPQMAELRRIVMDGLSRSALFFSAALPRTILPPLFNCYTGEANFFGNHVDNAVRSPAGSAEQVRTDLSATLFLAAPEDYDGGELVIEDTFGTQRVKLPAGHLVLYPSSSLHRVEPVTRGARLASFLWLQSLVRETERRRLLFEMDMALLGLRQQPDGEDSAEVVRLTACYHNLLRMWAEV
jgi:PKHD-type hydroxylase